MFIDSTSNFWTKPRRLPWDKPPYRFRCETLKCVQAVSDRQQRLKGWEQDALSKAEVLCVGAGGLGGETSKGLAQEGTGQLTILDHDVVSPTNLNRQHFYRRDLYENKAVALARNLSKECVLGTKFLAYPCSFQNRPRTLPRPDLIIAGVDNQFPETRLEICQYAYLQKIPAIIMGVTPEADAGYVYVQEPGEACWACAFRPEEHQDQDVERCPATPAAMPILQALGGLAVYAANSILMDLPRDWNYWHVNLSHREFGGPLNVEPRPGCPICDSQPKYEAYTI